MGNSLKIKFKNSKLATFINNLLQRFKFKLFIKGKKIKIDYKHEDIYIYVDSMREFDSRVNSAKGEPDTIEWIEKYIKPNDTLFDIGANVGTYSLIAAKSKKCCVYSFEPMSLNFHKLTENINLNKLNRYIVPVNVAISDLNIIDKFNLSSMEAGSACHDFGTTKDQENNDFEPVYFQYQISFTLDSFIKFYNLSVPNHIKIDVDGIEGSILKGGMETLRNRDLKSVLIEVNTKHDVEEIENLMTKYDFIIKSKNCIQGSSYNYLFMR